MEKGRQAGRQTTSVYLCMASMLGVPPERVNERCNAGWHSTKLHFDKILSEDNFI